jgi:uncharacterized protein YigA (DUF484 family)
MTDTAPLSHPITEDDIAYYLANTPGFFERHAQLLSAVQLSSGFGTRAVSLQERQAEMLRDKIKVIEHRMMDMIRYGNDNVLISNKLHRWSCHLLQNDVPSDLPGLITHEICNEFAVPQAAIKVWSVTSVYQDCDFARGVGEDTKTFAASLTSPFCGLNSGFEATQWLDNPAAALSLCMIPLRPGAIRATSPAIGLLVLASPDPQRFHNGMGTDFLERIGELASAALSRLR